VVARVAQRRDGCHKLAVHRKWSSIGMPGNAIAGTAVIYLDGLRIGTTRESVDN
jgi:hypothetical protein